MLRQVHRDIETRVGLMFEWMVTLNLYLHQAAINHNQCLNKIIISRSLNSYFFNLDIIIYYTSHMVYNKFG